MKGPPSSRRSSISVRSARIIESSAVRDIVADRRLAVAGRRALGSFSVLPPACSEGRVARPLRPSFDPGQCSFALVTVNGHHRRAEARPAKHGRKASTGVQPAHVMNRPTDDVRR
jgi:hypothetical protein